MPAGRQVDPCPAFLGPKGSGKGTLAMLLAQAVNCLEAEGEVPCGTCLSCRKTKTSIIPMCGSLPGMERHIKIEQRPWAGSGPGTLRGKKRVFILDNAEDMTVPAANSLLKLLEEPPPYADVYLLILPSPEILLPTILSRCQALPFGRQPRQPLQPFS
jgi:DNA polymerase III subunit delta'